jgi:hypothetical protein
MGDDAYNRARFGGDRAALDLFEQTALDAIEGSYIQRPSDSGLATSSSAVSEPPVAALQQLAHNLNARIREKYAEHLRPWERHVDLDFAYPGMIPSDQRNELVIFLNDEEFNAIYDFHNYPPSLRDNACGFSIPEHAVFVRIEMPNNIDSHEWIITHELFHFWTSPEFRELSKEIALGSGLQIYEGTAQWLTFDLLAPEDVRNQSYAYHKFYRRPEMSQELRFWQETLVAEEMFETLGQRALRAHFRGDLSALDVRKLRRELAFQAERYERPTK